MEKNSSVYNSTIKTYENTIRQMEERGCSEREILPVKDALANFIASVKVEETMALAYDEPKEQVTKQLPYEMTGESVRLRSPNGSVNPLKTNMFIVTIGDIPVYYPHYVGYDFDKKEFHVAFYETEDFSPFNYLNKKGKFNEVTIEFLDPTGRIIRVETFSKVKVKRLGLNGLTYKSDDILSSYATFKYKKHGITTCKEKRNISETEVEDREEKEADGLGDYQEEHSKE